MAEAQQKLQTTVRRGSYASYVTMACVIAGFIVQVIKLKNTPLSPPVPLHSSGYITIPEYCARRGIMDQLSVLAAAVEGRMAPPAFRRQTNGEVSQQMGGDAVNYLVSPDVVILPRTDEAKAALAAREKSGAQAK